MKSRIIYTIEHSCSVMDTTGQALQTPSSPSCHQTSSLLNNLIYVHLFDCVFALLYVSGIVVCFWHCCMFLYHHCMLNYCELYLMCEMIPLLCPNKVILFLLYHMIHPSDQSHHSRQDYIITLHMSFWLLLKTLLSYYFTTFSEPTRLPYNQSVITTLLNQWLHLGVHLDFQLYHYYLSFVCLIV